MAKNPFQPNHRGLVPVKMLKSYASNVAGETAGFLPDIAKELVRKGVAVLPGHNAPASAAPEGDNATEITSRQFRKQRDPFDHDGDGNKGGSVPADQRDGLDQLRAEFKELTGGTDADNRWGQARLEAEIKKAQDAKAEAEAADGSGDAGEGSQADGE